jgi:hypothetical protein
LHAFIFELPENFLKGELKLTLSWLVFSTYFNCSPKHFKSGKQKHVDLLIIERTLVIFLNFLSLFESPNVNKISQRILKQENGKENPLPILGCTPPSASFLSLYLSLEQHTACPVEAHLGAAQPTSLIHRLPRRGKQLGGAPPIARSRPRFPPPSATSRMDKNQLNAEIPSLFLILSLPLVLSLSLAKEQHAPEHRR